MQILLVAILLFLFPVCKKIKIRKKRLQLAKIDSQTGILNRVTFFKYGHICFTRAISNNEDLTVILFDVDDFKAINDNYGLEVGDDVIKMITEFGREFIGSTDLFARIGGEEFIILLPQKNIVEGEILAEKLRERICAANFNYLGIDNMVTISLGVSSIYQAEPWLDDLLHNAAHAMSSAKSKGRNQTIIYDSKQVTSDETNS